MRGFSPNPLRHWRLSTIGLLVAVAIPARGKTHWARASFCFGNECDDRGGHSNALAMVTNVLAAEVHQSSASSSELAFDLQLTAIPTSSSLLLQQARLGGSWGCIGTTQVTNWKKRLKSPDRGRRCLGARLPRLSIIRAANGSFACANRETLWWPPSQRRHVAPVPPEGESSLRTQESFANLLQRHSL